MSETLLDRAIRNYNFAVKSLKYIDDEFDLNVIGYHYQQASELALKHIIELSGIPYPTTHKIDILLKLVPSNILSDYILEQLLLTAGTLTNMESQTRCVKDYFLSHTQLNLISPIVRQLLEECINIYGSEVKLSLYPATDKSIKSLKLERGATTWNVTKFVKAPYLNVEKIFPLKQREVEIIVEAAKSTDKTCSVTIFGSSVTSLCELWSDIDVYITGITRDEIRENIIGIKSSLNLWFDGDISEDEPIYQDIKSKGVLVYERK